MAIQRLSLANLETQILELTGYSASTVAPWLTSANLYKRINDYVQRLPITAVAVGRSGGLIPQTAKILKFDMYRTVAASAGTGASAVVVTASSATIYLPSDYDHYISLYDVTNKRDIPITEEVDKYYLTSLRNKLPGPPEACEISGFETASTVWRRKGTLYPATVSGLTPSLSLTYWRIPAMMAGSDAANEYPDIDPKYEQVIPFGVARQQSRSQTPETQRWQGIETEILLQMAATARVI